MATRQFILMTVVAALSLGLATTVSATQKIPATGQTTCYDSAGVDIPCAGTGQDGDVQMGRTLRYVDQGNGTIKDQNTELYWEKKSDDDSIHDKDNTYTWQEALDYAANLNHICEEDETISCETDADCEAVDGAGDECGFAGKQDWRLSNVRELSTLVNFGVFSNSEEATPTVSDAFNTDCETGVSVLDGSCTHADYVTHNPLAQEPSNDGDFVPFGTVNPEGGGVGLQVPFTYWTSTSGDKAGDAWFVDFFTGDTGAHGKDQDLEIDECPSRNEQGACSAPEAIFAGHVRAVRRGSYRGSLY